MRHYEGIKVLKKRNYAQERGKKLNEEKTLKKEELITSRERKQVTETAQMKEKRTNSLRKHRERKENKNENRKYQHITAVSCFCRDKVNPGQNRRFHYSQDIKK